MKIAVAKGDGIGPEIMDAVLNIFKAAEVPLEYQFVEMGVEVYKKGESTGMTADAKQAIEANGILFKGPMETPKGKGVKSINVTARKVWNTYANKRVFKTLNGVDTVFSKAGIPIDITIVRENIEDTYGGIEHMMTHDVALCRRFITRPGSLQVHRYAFEMAKKKGAKKVTCAHKSNIMKITDGLFLETFYEVAKAYPMIEADDIIIDDLAMKLVSRPDIFDVIILPNLQGDIMSDLCAGLVGGLGFAPSANIGHNICIFEAVHGTAPDLVGQNKANPTALLMSGILMLRHIGLVGKAAQIEAALHATLMGGSHTADFGNKNSTPLSTGDFADKIIENLFKTNTTKEDKITYSPPKMLAENPLIQTPYDAGQIIGVDLFVEWNGQPSALGELVQSKLPAGYTLSTMTNRGTQVYPTGSVFTECINQYRVRVETTDSSAVSQSEIMNVASIYYPLMKFCSLELLMMYGGKKAFSLGQGQ